MKRMLLLPVLLMLAGSLGAYAASPTLSPPVMSWIAAQTNFQTWSADLTQTRTLKSLTGSLTATGRVWFAEPDQFRWELGQPPETIAIRAHTELLILYPKLKRVERISLAGKQTGTWRSALNMLEAGFPRSQKQLQSRYEIISQNVTNQICRLVLQPRSSAVQKMVPRIEIDFSTHDFLLRGTELEFSDGSTMRNDFYHVKLNPKLNDSLFAPDIPKDYTVVEPLKKR